MDLLIKWAKPISSQVRGDLQARAHHAVVTFDDGFENVLIHALPEMEKRKIPSTLFIPSSNLGRFPAWLNNTDSLERFETIVSPTRLKCLDEGLISIGSHGVTHKNFADLDEAEIRQELRESKRALEAILHREVTEFAFPYGQYKPTDLTDAKQAGYKRVFTIRPGFAFSEKGEFVTGRIDVSPKDWYLEFWLKLMGAYRWLPVAFYIKRKLLLIKNMLMDFKTYFTHSKESV
jgi:peptidoglycan/xylan/chitin deacetylase (PgdA/CDA1 family)